MGSFVLTLLLLPDVFVVRRLGGWTFVGVAAACTGAVAGDAGTSLGATFVTGGVYLGVLHDVAATIKAKARIWEDAEFLMGLRLNRRVAEDLQCFWKLVGKKMATLSGIEPEHPP
jgi:hypothetical protein